MEVGLGGRLGERSGGVRFFLGIGRGINLFSGFFRTFLVLVFCVLG